MSDPVLISMIGVAPSILWLFFALILVFIFRDDIRQIANHLMWRLKNGAAIKIASFELGESTYILPGKGEPQNGKLVSVKTDTGKVRYNERSNYYLPNRDLFLVHTIAPSKDPKGLYDIRMYIIPHKEATLIGVQSVEYYFGKYWHDRIFVSTDRSNGFLVSTSAYGPFVCTAELHFTDGNTATLWRYIDFEMGSIGKNLIGA